MKMCSRCFYTDLHPLGLMIDDSGVCSGCRVHEEKDSLDWNKRKALLGDILSNYKNKNNSNYDCIIPVSGARDSFFIVHTIKKEFGLNPLLVTYNKHYNTDMGYRNLARLRTALDCDLLTLTVDPQKVKKITRATLRMFGSMYWHCLAGQTVFPVQTAVRFKIPLIIWGAHQGLDQVGMYSHLDEVEMTRKYRKDHDLMGFEAQDLINDFDGIIENDVQPFFYPESKEIEAVGVRGIYLNNYIRWDTKAQHEKMIKLYNYEFNNQTRTFDNYNDVDCFNYSDVHDYIKFMKHGYGKIVDHVNREIRLRRLNREEGLNIINHYSVKKPEQLSNFLNWIGMDENAFNYIIDYHRSKLVWKRDENWNWKQLLNLQTELVSNNEIQLNKLEPKENSCTFQLTDSKRPNFPDNKYFIIGKGDYGFRVDS